MAMLDDVKLALRITTNAFDSELSGLISAGVADLGVAGVTEDDTSDPLVKLAVTTYCKMHFGDPETNGVSSRYDRLKRSYDEQKAQLVTCTGYTEWTGQK